MKNQELSRIFFQIADILELKQVQWKPIAYRKAARSLDSLTKDVTEIYKEGGIKALKEIPGVGEGIARKIEEYLKTGKIKAFQKLKSQLPEGLPELMDVMGMGPKKAQLFYKKLKIKSVKDLEIAIKKHKLLKIEGIKEKTEENLAKALELHKKRKLRTLLGEALPIALEIKSQLFKLKETSKVELAGSLRRGKETVGDLDILVTSSKPEKLIDYFTKLKEVKRVLAKGHTKATVLLKNNLQADLRVLPDEDYGAALQYFIGSKEHNVKLRELAIKKGYKLSEYGLFDKNSNRKIASRSEQEIYKKLGLIYIQPELRENLGEIEAASKNKLPNLVELQEIRGDLHLHTNWSDGVNTVEEMIKVATNLNYNYIAISDHSSKLAVTNGLDKKRFLQQIKEIDKIQDKYSIKVFKSAEVDIKSDGSLEIDKSIIKELDFIIAAIHSGFKQDQKTMTARIIKALESGNVSILAHPTGRLINRRDPLNLDIEKVFQVAKSNSIALEINSQPDRLDLNDINAKLAKEMNIKLVINTDSHHISELNNILLAVITARRAWCESKNILNTSPLNILEKSLLR